MKPSLQLTATLVLIIIANIRCMQSSQSCTQGDHINSNNHNHTKVVLEAPEKREATAWRWKYFDEFVPDRASVLVREPSLDERLANVIYTVGSSKSKLFFPRLYSGDPKRDELNMRLIAGPQVDDELCGEHLRDMLHQIDQLNHLLQLKRADKSNSLILDESHIQLARVLDSFGRYESGHLAGKTHSLGSYDVCRVAQLNLLNDSKGKSSSSSSSSVKTRFCWAHMSLDEHLDGDLLRRPKTRFETEVVLISSGICVPETCHSRSFHKNRALFQRLVDTQFKLPQSIYVNENLKLDSIYCLIDSDSQWTLPFSGRLLLGLLAAWLLAGLLVTLGVIPTNCCSAWNCLNFLESWREFKSTGDVRPPPPPPTDDNRRRHETSKKALDFASLNTVKVLATAYVVLGHVFLYWWLTSMNYLRMGSEYQTSRILMPMMIGAYVVDMFFVMTGLLTSYHILKQIINSGGGSQVVAGDASTQASNSNTAANGRSQSTSKELLLQSSKQESALQSLWKQIKLTLYYIVARYLRLVPMYYLVFWFKKSVLIYTAGGPFWDSPLNRNTLFGNCHYDDHWLTPLSPLAAYMPTSLRCLPQSWSISSDLFFTYFMVPVLVLAGGRHFKLATSLLIGLSALSVKMAWTAFEEANSKAIWEVNELKSNGFGFMLNELSYLYTGPHYRFTSMASGVLAGMSLVKYEKTTVLLGAGEDKKSTSWRRWWWWRNYTGIIKRLATCLACLCALYPFVTAAMMREIKPLVADVQQLYPNISTTYRAIWASSVAFLLFRIVADWSERAFFAWGRAKLWRIPVKLDYMMLLVHIDVILLLQTDWTASKVLNKKRALVDFVSAYFISLLVSSLIHVLFENPINKLVRRLFFKSRLDHHDQNHHRNQHNQTRKQKNL